jgi:hypothetical protein
VPWYTPVTSGTHGNMIILILSNSWSIISYAIWNDLAHQKFIGYESRFMLSPDRTVQFPVLSTWA